MPDPDPKLAAQHQTLVIIWGALLFSQVIFLVMLFLIKGELFQFRFDQPLTGQSGTMILGFAVAAIVCVGLSFAFSKRFLERSVHEQSVELVQTGMIIGLALCEASSLIGLCLAFAFDYQYFFAWFVLGIGAMIFHFPRRTDLLAATYKAGSR